MTWTPEFRVPSRILPWFACLYLPGVGIIGMPHCKQLFGCWGLNPGFHACYKKHRINWTISPSLTSLLLRKEIPNKLACRSYSSSLMQTFRLRTFGSLGPMCFALLLGPFLIYSTLQYSWVWTNDVTKYIVSNFVGRLWKDQGLLMNGWQRLYLWAIVPRAGTLIRI